MIRMRNTGSVDQRRELEKTPLTARQTILRWESQDLRWEYLCDLNISHTLILLYKIPKTTTRSLYFFAFLADISLSLSPYIYIYIYIYIPYTVSHTCSVSYTSESLLIVLKFFFTYISGFDSMQFNVKANRTPSKDLMKKLPMKKVSWFPYHVQIWLSKIQYIYI